MLTWAREGWHASTAFTFAGRNNTLNQSPYTLVDARLRKDFGHVDITIAGTNVFNAVSGPFTLYDAGVPYRGLYSSGNGPVSGELADRRALRSTRFDKVYRDAARMTAEMDAVRLHETGGPQSLRIDRTPVPEPGEGEVLVRLRAAALNHRDVFITQGLYPNIRLPVTLGSDGAGEVVAGNGDSSGLRAGEEVVIDPMLGWGDDPRVWDPASSLARHAARRNVCSVRHGPSAERLSQARAALDGRGRRDSARWAHRIPRCLYARRVSSAGRRFSSPALAAAFRRSCCSLPSMPARARS